MAARTESGFPEKFSPFIKRQIELARSMPDGARTVEVLERQYLRDDREDAVSSTEVLRHYEAMIPEVPGAERIYRTTILIEPTTTCAAHCRWCLRAQYDPLQLSDDQLRAFAVYCGQPERAGDLREVLVTGGDPLLVPKKIEFLLQSLAEHAPNIQKVRIGTRIPLQAPERVTDQLLDVLARFRDTAEIGIHINHTTELFPEVVEALKKVLATGVGMYNHTVLLRGVNDSKAELIDLCNQLRTLSIESHYLFHCVPMIGMGHHRTSVARGLSLASSLASSGEVSGRSRPVFALLTALGKVIPYEGTFVERDGMRLLVQTEFRYDERLRLNPGWKLPSSAIVGDDGRMLVWYEDAPDAE